MHCELEELIARYDHFLLDAYGVLVDDEGPLDGAAAALHRLDDAGRRWTLLSNDASRSAEAAVKRYRGFGLPVTPERWLSAGDLIAAHFQAHRLIGETVVVLGPADSRRIVTDAGGECVAPGEPARVLVIADDAGYDLRDGVEAALNGAVACVERGDDFHGILANPDIVYPRRRGALGLTAGAVALLIEAGLRVRFGQRAPAFHRLGKPGPALFEEAMRRWGEPDRGRVVMVGDQLATDVRGARDFGIDAVLVGTGLTPLADWDRDPAARPTWTMAAFEP